jgi:hypothetical protein
MAEIDSFEIAIDLNHSPGGDHLYFNEEFWPNQLGYDKKHESLFGILIPGVFE